MDDMMRALRMLSDFQSELGRTLGQLLPRQAQALSMMLGGDSDSDDSDLELIMGRLRPRRQDDRSGFSGDLRLTFEYPRGTQRTELDRFDVRPEACMAVGGARHKDIVLAEDGQVATVIGVRDQPPRLFCHMEGLQGAGVFPKGEKLRVVSSLDVLPPGIGNVGRAPSQQHGWLEPTFRYLQGPRGTPHLELFDIRHDMCLKVGGFHHGQVVQSPGGREHVTIGVRKDDDDNRVHLWFHTRGALGAGIFKPDFLSKLRSVGVGSVREGGREEEGSFRYPSGLVCSSMDSFDVRPEIYQANATQLCDMGFPRAEVEWCLAAAFLNAAAAGSAEPGPNAPAGGGGGTPPPAQGGGAMPFPAATGGGGGGAAVPPKLQEGAVAAGAGRCAEGGSAGEVRKCCVCLDREKSHAFLPCGHMCACMDCAAILVARSSPCPICRQRVERSVQVFV